MAQIDDFTAIDSALDDLETAVAGIETLAEGDVQEGQAHRSRYVAARSLAERLAALTQNRPRQLIERY